MSAGPEARPFEVVSADGVRLSGQVDLPTKPSGTAVIFASGSGLFDRDMVYGRSGTPRDRVFKDLAARLVAHGAMAVRHDRRGVRFGVEGPGRIDNALTVTTTTRVQVEDLAAVYAWTRAPEGLGARRVVFLAHSEGTLHVGRLAASGAPAPLRVVGMGALMESPASVLHWRMVEREIEAIARLDADGDGVVSNAEIEAGWRRTPAAHSTLEDMLSPEGAWTSARLEALRARRQAAYDEARREALATPDDRPYPGPDLVAGPYQWWKSWFTDETPNARNLAAWPETEIVAHYGAIDSQTSPRRQTDAAFAALPSSRLSVTVHPGTGHALGEDAAFGPMDDAIANAVADAAAFA